MTTFKAALGLCGLSQADAADRLGVSLGSVKDWCRKKSDPPLGVWQDLAGLFAEIRSKADAAVVPEDKAAMNEGGVVDALAILLRALK